MAAAGCGGGGANTPPAHNADGSVTKTLDGKAVSVAAENKFKDALDALVAHDKANDWNEQVCNDIAHKFDAAADENPDHKFTEATYNAGLIYQRCGNDKEAKDRFQKALSASPKFHYARSQLALYQYKADGNLDAAISELDRVVSDAIFQNVPALVNLAMFQMQRDSPRGGGENCKSAGKDNKEIELADFECARLNLQRALAIDDTYMPASNQLALYYFNGAKKRVLGKANGPRRAIESSTAVGKHADSQEMELAALVCSQAIRKNSKYAPIHNTNGLILNELGLKNAAVAEFNEAAALDPKLFEAWMNLAAINLSFRGFEKAQAAYKKALEMRPNDYDAHLGMALAIRGQILPGPNYDTMIAQVQSELDTCKRLDGSRPDAFYNEGILGQKYKYKGGTEGAKSIAAGEAAKASLQSFIDKAQGKPEYDTAVKDAKDWMKDIDDLLGLARLAAQAPPPQPPPAASSGGSAPAAASSAPAAPAPSGSSAPAP